MRQSKTSKLDLNKALLARFGDTSVVNLWWNSPNWTFDLKTPFETYEKDPEVVTKYILEQASK